MPSTPLPGRPVPRRVVAALLLGTLLNPLNSSMIAVALVQIEREFAVGIVAASWLISAFYLASAVGQPVFGRLADRFGPRRVYCLGLVLVGVAGVLGPLAPTFGWLLAARVLLACGASACFPAALAILRRAADGLPSPGTLGAVSIAGSVSAALGPVVGGALVALAGWEAIFIANVAVLAFGLPPALRWLPADRERLRGLDAATVRRAVDGPGIALFSAMLASALGLLLSIGEADPAWWLVPLTVVAGLLFVWRELRHPEPIVDVRALVRDRPLIRIYAQYAGVNVVFYGVFFSFPIWLEQARGASPGVAGLLMLPIAACGVAATPLAARLISRAGIRPALVAGAVALTAGTVLLMTVGDATPIVALVAIGTILGLPNGFNNLGLQSALYAAAPPERTGAAAGLFQMSRFVGAVLSTSLIGIVFADAVTSDGLRTIALALTAVSAAVLVASVRGRPGRVAEAETA